MGTLLLLLVIVNSFLTGWLLAQVKGLKKTVASVAKVQRDISDEFEAIADDYEDAPRILRGRSRVRDVAEV